MALQSSNEDKKLTSPNIGPTSRTVKQMNNITQLNLLNCDHIEVSQNSNSSIDLECSLFLDETNREFDDYLNTLSPRSSKPPIEDEDFMEDQDFESKTMNNLSKNIKGKFQKVMRRSKKNKFFKSSRPIQGLMSGNEIPVINEAMKKIFKPLNDKPCLKYTPKTMVKTYTNKHKDNSSYVVETFGLPDEPLIPSSNSCAIGKGSIDLDVEMNCNNSRLASPWTVENQANAAEMAIGEDIRRSYSLLEDFSPTILESVEDDFDLEDNIQDIDAENAMREKLSEPQIVLEPIDLSDRLLFKMNKLSPIKNRKELLFERLLNYSENFNSSQNRLSNTKLGKSENILSSNSLTNKKNKGKVLESLSRMTGDNIVHTYTRRSGRLQTNCNIDNLSSLPCNSLIEHKVLNIAMNYTEETSIDAPLTNKLKKKKTKKLNSTTIGKDMELMLMKSPVQKKNKSNSINFKENTNERKPKNCNINCEIQQKCDQTFNRSPLLKNHIQKKCDLSEHIDSFTKVEETNVSYHNSNLEKNIEDLKHYDKILDNSSLLKNQVEKKDLFIQSPELGKTEGACNTEIVKKNMVQNLASPKKRIRRTGVELLLLDSKPNISIPDSMNKLCTTQTNEPARILRNTPEHKMENVNTSNSLKYYKNKTIEKDEIISKNLIVKKSSLCNISKTIMSKEKNLSNTMILPSAGSVDCENSLKLSNSKLDASSICDTVESEDTLHKEEFGELKSTELPLESTDKEKKLLLTEKTSSFVEDTKNKRNSPKSSALPKITSVRKTRGSLKKELQLNNSNINNVDEKNEKTLQVQSNLSGYEKKSNIDESIENCTNIELNEMKGMNVDKAEDTLITDDHKILEISSNSTEEQLNVDEFIDSPNIKAEKIKVSTNALFSFVTSRRKSTRLKTKSSFEELCTGETSTAEVNSHNLPNKPAESFHNSKQQGNFKKKQKLKRKSGRLKSKSDTNLCNSEDIDTISLNLSDNIQDMNNKLEGRKLNESCLECDISQIQHIKDEEERNNIQSIIKEENDTQKVDFSSGNNGIIANELIKKKRNRQSYRQKQHEENNGMSDISLEVIKPHKEQSDGKHILAKESNLKKKLKRNNGICMQQEEKEREKMNCLSKKYLHKKQVKELNISNEETHAQKIAKEKKNKVASLERMKKNKDQKPVTIVSSKKSNMKIKLKEKTKRSSVEVVVLQNEKQNEGTNILNKKSPISKKFKEKDKYLSKEEIVIPHISEQNKNQREETNISDEHLLSPKKRKKMNGCFSKKEVEENTNILNEESCVGGKIQEKCLSEEKSIFPRHTQKKRKTCLSEQKNQRIATKIPIIKRHAHKKLEENEHRDKASILNESHAISKPEENNECPTEQQIYEMNKETHELQEMKECMSEQQTEERNIQNEESHAQSESMKKNEFTSELQTKEMDAPNVKIQEKNEKCIYEKEESNILEEDSYAQNKPNDLYDCVSQQQITVQIEHVCVQNELKSNNECISEQQKEKNPDEETDNRQELEDNMKCVSEQQMEETNIVNEQSHLPNKTQDMEFEQLVEETEILNRGTYAQLKKINIEQQRDETNDLDGGTHPHQIVDKCVSEQKRRERDILKGETHLWPKLDWDEAQEKQLDELVTLEKVAECTSTEEIVPLSKQIKETNVISESTSFKLTYTKGSDSADADDSGHELKDCKEENIDKKDVEKVTDEQVNSCLRENSNTYHSDFTSETKGDDQSLKDEMEDHTQSKTASDAFIDTKFENTKQIENSENNLVIYYDNENKIEDKLKYEKISKKQDIFEYLDVGYDIHRRTSFRKILERVMELSKNEIKTKELETSRLQRCKSVPHEDFYSEKEMIPNPQSLSVDNKYKYLNEKTTLIENMDQSRIKRRLSYSFGTDRSCRRNRTKSVHVTRVDLDSKRMHEMKNIGRSKSVLGESFDVCYDVVANEKIDIKKKRKRSNSGSNVHGSNESIRDDKSEFYKKNTEVQSINKAGTSKNDNLVHKEMYDKPESQQIVNSELKSYQNSFEEEVDLEVERLQSGNYSTKRTRCYSEGANVQTDATEGLVRSKSVFGRSRKMSRRSNGRPRKKSRSKWRREIAGFEKMAEEETHSKASKKVYEFKIGDSVWGKVGAYPYWPCLIMSDPITSEFKKYKLLRTTPYYHVRFFGDKGKRSWTTHVIPYETPDDLEMLAKISCREGIQMSVIKECYFVKPKQMNKWKQAVAEAESIKNESVETKLEFFNKIFSIGINPQFDVAVDTNKSVPNEDENDERDSSSLNSKKNIKKSSVLSSIEAVVARCSEEEDDSDQISLKKHSTPKMERGRQRKKTENGDFDLGLELLHLPPIDSVSAPAYTPERSPLGKSTTPTDITVPSIKRNPQRRKSSPNIIADVLETLQRKRGKSRSRSSSRINMSSGNKEEIKADFQSPPQEIKPIWSPPKLREKKQAQQVDQSDCESKASDNSFKNIHVSQLSQWKKNLFRGITKEKVCQICEMPGDVIKCRGPCNGDYHIRCVEDSLKFTEDQNLEMKKVEKAGTEQVQIITVGSRKKLLPANIALSPSNRQMPISDQIDRKMKEIMNQAYEQTESTDSSGEEMTCDKLKYELPVKIASSAGKSQKGKGVFKHVTADDVSIIHITDEGTMERRSVQNENETAPIDECVYKCPFCTSSVIPPCFVCNAVVSKKGNSMRQRCSLQKCGRFYHLECLNIWPQTQWSFILHEKRKTEAFDSFVCPRHVCHICASDNLGFSIGRCPNDKLVKCLRCPATYHNSHHCVPAGTQILTSTQIICPRHLQGNKKPITSNTVWCFVCSEGGNLICCETCPTSVHSECLQVNLMDDDTYICEDCESGRFPLYDEVVWVKCGKFRWWPATILFPSEVPLNVEAKAHNKGDFVVKFFGTYDYYWVGRGRTFLYQEGDTGCLNSCKNRIDEAFSRALKEAAEVYHLKKESKSKRDKEVNNGLKPPPYVKIKVNRPVGNVRVFEGNLSNTTSCDCNPEDVNPCGPNSNCLNRILLTECNPEICPAEQRCKNQCFEKREYPQMIPYRTPSRGWGLKTLEPLVKGQFIIEYVGEIIDDEEYQRRIKKMHEQKDENYYFLTIDNNRMLDAGPKGNAARFMNHSCQPNCETQKWTVNGDTRVGLFALEDIPENTELTFNYNLECVGTEKKICRCGAPNCSGFIGLKPEDQRPPKRSRVEKKKEPEPHQQVIEEYPCFVCGKDGGVRICTNKSCSKSYHLKCVQLESLPEGKWNCPSHSCNICSRRTTRSCTKCINSFCPSHSEGQIRYDNVLGYICKQHDPTRERKSKITSKETLECSSSRKNLKAKSTPSLLKGKSRKRQRDSDISDKFSSKRLKINSN